MNQKVSDLSKKERVCALTTLLGDGTLHNTAMHFSFTENPLTFYFSTDKTSQKCLGWLEKGNTKAAIAIGFSEQDWLTLALVGDIKVLTNSEEIVAAKKIHYAKIPSSQKFESDPNTIFLAFTPSYWKYTDFNTEPVTVYDH